MRQIEAPGDLQLRRADRFEVKYDEAVRVFAIALLSACSSPVTWHGDVKPIVDARCVACHGANSVLPLTSYKLAAGTAIADAVASKRMPPPLGVHSGIMSLAPGLTEAQRLTFAKWASAGFLEGDPSKPGTPLPDPFTCPDCLAPPRAPERGQRL